MLAYLLALGNVFSGDVSKAYAAHATQLHAVLFGESSNYDKTIPPSSSRDNPFFKAGTDVTVQIRFFKVNEVSAADGRMALKVWLRNTWNDDRLSWEPSAHGNITMIPALASSISTPEDSEIWLPDLKVYNSRESIMSTLDPAIANVYSTGSIFWSRPGNLEVLCKFSGLVAFPFDDLRCAFEIGGWGLSGRYQGIQLKNASQPSKREGLGWQFSNDEDTTGSTYQEYQIKHVTAKVKNLVYYEAGGPDAWPLATYTITLNRSAYFYYNAIIFPGFVFSLLSFAAFFMAHNVGERLGYCITLILAIEVSKVVIAEMIPVCGELLWVELFGAVNFVFATLSLLLSVVSLWLGTRD